jgi:GNAT superfamily N-acetyltransferase
MSPVDGDDAARAAAPGDHERVDGSRVEVRRARTGDAGAVAGLAGELAQSFPFSRQKFDRAYPALVASEDACLLVAAEDGECLGYVLGFRHLTFYANGPVGWVEELLVRQAYRGRGLGRALMAAFERWAAGQGCVLVALATRRAAPFYQALGYAESAAYLRKVLPSPAP